MLKDSWIKNSMDLPFFLILLLVLSIGLVMLLSSSYFYAYYNVDSDNPLYFFTRQLAFAVAGIGVLYVVSKFDYHQLRDLSSFGMLIALVCLIAALCFPSEDGIKRWIYIGSFSFQPSEI